MAEVLLLTDADGHDLYVNTKAVVAVLHPRGLPGVSAPAGPDSSWVVLEGGHRFNVRTPVTELAILVWGEDVPDPDVDYEPTGEIS